LQKEEDKTQNSCRRKKIQYKIDAEGRICNKKIHASEKMGVYNVMSFIIIHLN
jgi:hypothetical protein